MQTKEQFLSAMRELPEGKAETPPTEADTEPETEPETAAPVPDLPEPEKSELPEPEAETPPKPRDLKDVLQDAGIDLDTFYDLTLSGTDITVGQAKDAAPDLADISRLKLEAQKQHDEITKQQTEYATQLEAAVSRLTQAFGADKVAEALQQAPADVQAAQEQAKAEFIRWRPELADEAQYNEAQARIGQMAEFYGLPAGHFEYANVGLKRAFLRLHQLESYLDTLRKPAKPPKKVRSEAKEKAPVRVAKKRKSTGSRQKDKWLSMVDELPR